MASIPRYPQKIFGGSLTPAGNVAVFGSLLAGAPTYPAAITDLDAIQSAAWLNGLEGCLIGNRSPTVQDLNAVLLTLSQQIAYLLQSGVPEWDGATTYWIGQHVRYPGTALIFTSLVDNNLANDPAVDTNNWSSSGSSNPSVASMSTSQTVAVDGAAHLINFDAVEFDPFNRYDVSAKKYTAPVPGAYLVTGNIQVDNADGELATMEISLTIVKNGSVTVRASGTSVPNPPGSRWYPKISTVIVLELGDEIDMRLTAEDGVDTGTITVSNSDWSIQKLP